MSALIDRARSKAPLVSRIAAALFGGYALAALSSVVPLALPISKPQAVLTGMLASFLIYAAVVIWVFAVRTAWKAWIGLIILAAILLPLAWTVS